MVDMFTVILITVVVINLLLYFILDGIYRMLKNCEKRDINLILDLKNGIKAEGISNIGIEFNQ